MDKNSPIDWLEINSEARNAVITHSQLPRNEGKWVAGYWVPSLQSVVLSAHSDIKSAKHQIRLRIGAAIAKNGKLVK